MRHASYCSPRTKVARLVRSISLSFMSRLRGAGDAMRSLSIRRFEFEQPAFSLEAPSVAAEVSRSAERAMARDYNRDWICAIGSADGANRARASDTSRDFGVRAGFAARNSAELVPYASLKRRAE